MKEFINLIAWHMFLSSLLFNGLAFGKYIFQYINVGIFIFTDVTIRMFNVGLFFLIGYLIICLIRWYLIKNDLI